MGAYHPRRAQNGGARGGHHAKVHGITLAELVAPARQGVLNEKSFQQEIAELVRVAGVEAQRTRKDGRFVATDWMRRIKTVIRQLTGVGDRMLGIWQKHGVLFIARPGIC